jgi:hypothetical protein
MHEREIYVKFSFLPRNHLEDLGVEVRIILKLMLK